MSLCICEPYPYRATIVRSVDAGGIPPLLSLLEGSSAKAKENSVSAIAKLAFKSLNIQTVISDSGGVPLLANVLISASANVKDLSAAQICSIAASAVSALAENNKEIAVAIAEVKQREVHHSCR